MLLPLKNPLRDRRLERLMKDTSKYSGLNLSDDLGHVAK